MVFLACRVGAFSADVRGFQLPPYCLRQQGPTLGSSAGETPAPQAGSGLFLNVLTDPFLGYFRNVYIFGQEYTIAKALTKITGGVTFVNSVASTVCVVILYLALRPALERAKLLTKGETK